MSRNIVANHMEYSHEAFDEKKNGEGKMLFTKLRGKDCAILINGGRMLSCNVLSMEKERIGAIYIAKVRNVVPNLNACFVEIAGGELCFLPFGEAKKFFRCSKISNRRNENVLCQGDEILVQIIKEAQKNKQTTVTAEVSLANEAAVIGLGHHVIGYSGKLTKEEKEYCKDILDKNGYIKNGCFNIPERVTRDIKNYLLDTINDTGMIVRTQAVCLEESVFLEKTEKLIREFFDLLVTARHRICFSCIKEPVSPCITALRQIHEYEYSEIVTDDELTFKELETYVSQYGIGKNVRFYQDEMLSLNKLYSLETKLEESLQERVWLKSGAYIVIQHTEAMTVIDVNSGKFTETGKKDMEFLVNKEAAEEIALQLRVRNISGIIIVDFINMKSKKMEQELLEALKKCVSRDRQKTMVVDITPLSLVELTRRKDNKSLAEQFS